MHGQFSVKSDVFSFGVLVLEIVSGQKNNCFRSGENVEDLLSNVITIILGYISLICNCCTSKLTHRNYHNYNRKFCLILCLPI
jgi:hypothetical protein